MAEIPICKQAVTFTKHHHGKNCFAPCTGQDYRVFSAFAHLASAWCAADDEGRKHIEECMRNARHAVQPKIVVLLKAAAVAAADWGMVDELWFRLDQEDSRRGAEIIYEEREYKSPFPEPTFPDELLPRHLADGNEIQPA